MLGVLWWFINWNEWPRKLAGVLWQNVGLLKTFWAPHPDSNLLAWENRLPAVHSPFSSGCAGLRPPWPFSLASSCYPSSHWPSAHFPQSLPWPASVIFISNSVKEKCKVHFIHMFFKFSWIMSHRYCGWERGSLIHFVGKTWYKLIFSIGRYLCLHFPVLKIVFLAIWKIISTLRFANIAYKNYKTLCEMWAISTVTA